MMRRLFITRLAVAGIALLLLILGSCVQTRTLMSDPDEALNRIDKPLFCGTFGSFIYYDKNSKPVFNYSLTSQGNAIYDSLIRKQAPKLAFLQKEFVKDSATAMELAGELSRLIEYVEKEESIRYYKVSGIFQRITEDHSNKHFLFFVPTGYTRSPENFIKEFQNPTPRSESSKKDMAFIIGMAMFGGLSAGISYFAYTGSDGRVHAHGSNCHIIVYNRERNEISLFRHQFFPMNTVRPLERKYLKKQVDYLLKEYL